MSATGKTRWPLKVRGVVFDFGGGGPVQTADLIRQTHPIEHEVAAGVVSPGAGSGGSGGRGRVHSQGIVVEGLRAEGEISAFQVERGHQAAVGRRPGQGGRHALLDFGGSGRLQGQDEGLGGKEDRTARRREERDRDLHQQAQDTHSSTPQNHRPLNTRISNK
ncbi:hypothetical protein CEXT_756341 [Caerostris extrusa]|uniref:Uncharacterized protein n=1 Tax=Caerostris extrusa TaxID=172846 RepID=A0AAV4QJF9_CAEEX|nr:hypothetical protein CEXT_756341 [Caerostris extrusa]